MRLNLTNFASSAYPRHSRYLHGVQIKNQTFSQIIGHKMKDILFVRIFLILGIFIEKITINNENHVYCPPIVHHISLGLSISVGSVRDISFTYLIILFQHQKKNYIVFT